MEIVDRIHDLQHAERSQEILPTSQLQRVLTKSEVEKSVEKLSELAKIQINKELIEDGKKMVIVVRWPMPNDRTMQNQLIVSAREGSLSFIGSHTNNQYLRLEGEKLFDKELAKEYLARTFVNPSRLKASAQD